MRYDPGRPTGTTLRMMGDSNPFVQAAGQDAYNNFSQMREQQGFERGILQQEQNRRQFDSETQREGQKMKYGVLGGLLGGSSRRTFGGR